MASQPPLKRPSKGVNWFVANLGCVRLPAEAACVLAGMCVLLAGCTHFSAPTPETAVVAVADAARHHRVRDFQAALTGDALVEYGTVQGLEKLQREMSTIHGIAPARLVTSRRGSQGHDQHGDVWRGYTLSVLGRTEEGKLVAYTVHIACDVRFKQGFWAICMDTEERCAENPSLYQDIGGHEVQACHVARIDG